jgi:hypothetical protein
VQQGFNGKEEYARRKVKSRRGSEEREDYGRVEREFHFEIHGTRSLAK